MDSHDLARVLYSMEPKPVTASVDIGVDGAEDTHCDRAFGSLIDINDIHSHEVVLLFEGSTNVDTIEQRGEEGTVMVNVPISKLLIQTTDNNVVRTRCLLCDRSGVDEIKHKKGCALKKVKYEE